MRLVWGTRALISGLHRLAQGIRPQGKFGPKDQFNDQLKGTNRSITPNPEMD
jgi:hypothetical protein